MLKRTVGGFLVFCMVLVNSIGFAAIPTVTNKRYWMAQKYIMNNILGIGVVNSYQEDAIDRSYVYDNCLAAMASMAQFNYALAKEILDTLCLEVTRTSVNNCSVFYEYYYYTNTSGNGGGIAYCGNSAWLLQALNIYQKRRPSDSARYRDTQEELAEFLVSLQDTDGGLVGRKGVTWKSAEHNLIAYVALGNYGRINNKPDYVTASDRIGNFLLSPAIWNTTDERFNRGAYDYDPVTDAQALGVLVFGSDKNAALDFAESDLKLTKSFVDYRGQSVDVTGFVFHGGFKNGVWIEGTLQMALAHKKYGDPAKATEYFNQTVKTRQRDGSLVLNTTEGWASSDWYHEVWRAIAPTAWVVFYASNFNPYIIY